MNYDYNERFIIADLWYHESIMVVTSNNLITTIKTIKSEIEKIV